MKSLAIVTVITLVLAGLPATVEPLNTEGSQQPGQDRGPGDRPGLSHERPAHGPGPVMQALDTDKDGELSAEEIKNAAASLLTLDKNDDGKLSRDELRPPRPEGPGTGGGRRPR